MILSSTVRKLAAKSATIYRVDVPAHKVTIGETTFHDVPAYREYFATLAQAENACLTFRPFASLGVPTPTISAETCTMEAHYWNT